jgi:hypothetical protein
MRTLKLGLEAISENKEALKKIPDSENRLASFFIRLDFLFRTVGDIERW